MSILTAKAILERMEKGDIKIEPFDRANLKPNGYDVTLSNTLLIYDNTILNMKDELSTSELYIPPAGLTLYPNTVYLGSSVEYTETYNLVPTLEGRSSLGRLGLDAHICARQGEIGYKGHWTFSIRCTQPVVIYPYIRLAQITYHTVEGEPEDYNGNYQSSGPLPTPSKMYLNFK